MPIPRPLILCLKISFNIIFPSTPRSSQLSPTFRFPHQNQVCIPLFLLICYMPSASHPHNIGVEYKSRRFSLCTFLQSPPLPPLLATNTFLCDQFWDTMNLCHSLNVSESPHTPEWPTVQVINPRIQLRCLTSPTCTHTHMSDASVSRCCVT